MLEEWFRQMIGGRIRNGLLIQHRKGLSTNNGASNIHQFHLQRQKKQ